MPELPEVEVVRRALEGALRHRVLRGVRRGEKSLRGPLPEAGGLTGARLAEIGRRGKFLLLRWEQEGRPAGTLVSHLGMTGAWLLVPRPAPAPGPHDHFDLDFGDVVARYRDPRRFGLLRLHGSEEDPLTLPPLSALGFEPWDPRLTPEVFREAMRGRRTPVKLWLLSGEHVVGCGNIYCSEALWRAGISPRRAAGRVTGPQAARLLAAVREVLAEGIEAGGSTIADFRRPDGTSGGFSMRHAVYGREGLPCPRCGTPVRRIVQSGRSTFFCPKCQK